MPHSPDFVHLLRKMELMEVKERFPHGARVLELGAGAGWQAKLLSEWGYDVVALDYAHPGFQALRESKVFPVGEYDGAYIPFDDNSFDVVFTSNVLEHVEQEETLHKEILRVLCDDGFAIHIVPSPLWRIWSTLSHYLFAIQIAFSRLCNIFTTSTKKPHAILPGKGEGVVMNKKKRSRLAFYSVPERHGEKGNFLTEVFHFSRWRWVPLFNQSGFSVVELIPVGFFYTGYGVLGDRLNTSWRKRLGSILGSATTLYVLKKTPKTEIEENSGRSR